MTNIKPCVDFVVGQRYKPIFYDRVQCFWEFSGDAVFVCMGYDYWRGYSDMEVSPCCILVNENNGVELTSSSCQFAEIEYEAA